MRASRDPRKFGYAEEPGVQVQLPLGLEAGKIDVHVSFKSRSSISDIFIDSICTADGKCQATIDIDGPATIASWYGMWEAVTVIASMCTRAKDKGGKAKNLGTSYAYKGAPTYPIAHSQSS